MCSIGFCGCFNKNNSDVEEEENINIYEDDYSNKYHEGNGILSLFKSLNNFSIHDDGIILEKMKYILTHGIEKYYTDLLSGNIPNFEPNSSDSIFALIAIGLHYGTRSPEYNKVKEYLFSGSSGDLRYIIEIPIENALHSNKKFKKPEKDIFGNYYSEKKDPNCYNIPEECSIVFFSDWATGSKSSINLLEEVAKLNPDIVIHLGDVYFSGTLKETKNNLVKPFKKYLSPQTKVFVIPGNHDYYSGNEGINYSLESFNQTSTFFSLYNSKIQIEGMDTGFNDSNCFNILRERSHNVTVVEEEQEWHLHRSAIALEEKRKLIFLSHHQVISPWIHAGHVNGKLSPLNIDFFNQFRTVISSVDLWLYGHDHSFAIMNPYVFQNVVLLRARLIGNGDCQYRDESYSNYQNISPGHFETDENDIPNPSIKDIFPGSFDRLINNSFALLQSSKKEIVVSYYEIPQVELGVFSAPKIIYQEVL